MAITIRSLSQQFDCFKYSFTRFILKTVWLCGCFLTLVYLIFYISSNKSLHYVTNHAIATNVSEGTPDTWRLNNFLMVKPGKVQEVEKTIGHSGVVKKWFQEGFPEINGTPSVEEILEIFDSKVKLKNRKVVDPHYYRYIHNVPNACVGRKVELFIGVPTRTTSFDARQAIRETWGSYETDPKNNAVVLFFLGAGGDRKVQDKINAEALKHGDIVQEDFQDSYRNLSLKTVALMKWVSLHCWKSTFVLKADDDMYINLPRLMLKLQEQFKRGPTFILGAVHFSTPPFRERGNKWFVTREEYPNKHFPNYVSGTAYAMTTSAAMRLYVESLYMKSLFLEDVFMTGMVADRAMVPRVGDRDFVWQKVRPDGCSFKDKISGHRNSPDDMRKIHKDLFDPNLRCNK